MKFDFRSIFTANNILLLSLVLMIFGVPLMPVPLHYHAYNVFFSLILLASATSLQRSDKKLLLIAAGVLIILVWVSFRLDNALLTLISRIPQGLFFFYIVYGLIRQTATAKRVTERVISDSISGFLLVGLLYGIIAFAIFRLHPDAFRFPEGPIDASLTREKMSDIMYYTFVTYTTTGYGDILPATSGVKALATLISATGQLYIAIIIALLVGKFASGVGKEE
jgi:hypothetical protein